MNLWRWLHRIQTKKDNRHNQRTHSNIVIQALEIERTRISRELHDSVGQALYSVLIGIKIVSQLKVDESVREHFLQVEQLTAKALEEVKRLAYDLHSSSLVELGLVPAIRSYLEQYEYTFGINTKFIHMGNTRRYHKDVETILYRICQEALTNIAKYAQTKEVVITLLDEITYVQLTVEDFGKGFEIDHDNREGIGLISFRERAKSLGGETIIRSIPGKGTTIEVTIPLI